MSTAITKTVWDTYEDWSKAQGNLRLYQEGIKAVENRLRGFTEEQRTLFTLLCAADSPPQKPKDGSPVV